MRCRRDLMVGRMSEKCSVTKRNFAPMGGSSIILSSLFAAASFIRSGSHTMVMRKGNS